MIVHRLHVASETILGGKRTTTLIYIAFEDSFSYLIGGLLLEHAKLYLFLRLGLSSSLLWHHLYIFDRWRCSKRKIVMSVFYRLCNILKIEVSHILLHESIHLILDVLSLS